MAADPPPRLHILCGRIASGKSTLAARLATPCDHVLIAEDAWLAALHPGALTTLDDYSRTSRALRRAMTPHIADLLSAGLTVVLDFAANTPGQRMWLRTLIDRTGVPHALHLLDTPEATCLARLRARNAAGTHEFTVDEAMFHAVSAHFTPPDPAEGFAVTVHRPDD